MRSLLRLGLLALLALLPDPARASGPSPERDDRPVLVLLAQGFNRGEYEIPARLLREAGHRLVVAGIEAGRVPLRLDGVPHEGDVVAELALRDIPGPEGYAALFIPGGYSPGFLERDPDAVRIAGAFMREDRIVAAICHGPRVLMAADTLRERVVTMLRTVPSERPEWWKEGRVGAYLDRAVVKDRNLLTARYPNDAEPLGRAFVAMLAGGRDAAASTLAADGIVHFALWPGFDEEVVLGLMPLLRAKGATVRVAGPEPGWVRGLHGFPLAVDETYGDLSPGAAVIAPGGQWPSPGPARQAEPAEWVERLAPQLEARKAWVLRSWREGGLVLAAGMDAELLAGSAELAGAPVAASAQLEWSFPRGGPRWVKDPLVLTADRLWTASGAEALPRLVDRVVPFVVGERSLTRVLRIGDSITWQLASETALGARLAEAGLAVAFLGSQHWSQDRGYRPAERAPVDESRAEAYPGMTLRWFVDGTPERVAGPASPVAVPVGTRPIDHALAQGSPDLVLVLLGTNDVARGPASDGETIDVAGLGAAYDELLETIATRCPGAVTIVGTLPAVNEDGSPERARRAARTLAFNEQVVRPAVARRMSSGAKILLVDLHPVLAVPTDFHDDGTASRDPVHPGQDGVRRLNEAWAAAIAAGALDAP